MGEQVRIRFAVDLFQESKSLAWVARQAYPQGGRKPDLWITLEVDVPPALPPQAFEFRAVAAPALTPPASAALLDEIEALHNAVQDGNGTWAQFDLYKQRLLDEARELLRLARLGAQR